MNPISPWHMLHVIERLEYTFKFNSFIITNRQASHSCFKLKSLLFHKPNQNIKQQTPESQLFYSLNSSFSANKQVHGIKIQQLHFPFF
ncbi:hypothetical protein OIU85_007238 [Salix viminalis]|uniref:Uncharacterized protein n=1 Tax=Salix viminalis TaxID=40686 RepID=A0A9Q0P8R7_SALVM|nr:hypothetical protein OIU85_007238 [Salix viminalis]